MRGSGISSSLFFPRSVDPQLIPFMGIRDQHPFPPHTPYLIDSGSLIPDPPLRRYRVISVGMVSGGRTSPTLPTWVPLASEYPGSRPPQ